MINNSVDLTQCPACRQIDRVAKVSTIYLMALGLNRKPRQKNLLEDIHQKQPPGKNARNTPDRDSNAPIGLNISTLPENDLKQLSQKLKPPASPKQAFSRPVHPDTVVLTFSLVVPFFIIGILQNQSGMIIPMVILLTLSYILYFLKRRQIVSKFNKILEERLTSEKRTRRALERWMSIYYCARDDVIFEPRTGRWAPLDQIHGFLNQE